MIDKLLPPGLLATLESGPVTVRLARPASLSRRGPLAAYPLLQASLLEAERNGSLKAEKRRIVRGQVRF